MLQRNDMHEYQKRAVQHIKKAPKCALWVLVDNLLSLQYNIRKRILYGL